MTITRSLWDTTTLLGVMQQTNPIPNYWLSLCFGQTVTFDSEHIEFEKIPNTGRKLAPLVTPMSKGRPIYERRTSAERVKAAYVKPKDAVSPDRMLTRSTQDLFNTTPLSPMARHNAIKADIVAYHRAAIERRWEWMAAQAILNGKVVLQDEGYPTVEVDFGRAAGHTITLGSGSRWGDSGVDILDNVQAWSDLMHAADFGGAPNRITVGTSVWSVMRKDKGLMDQMDKNRRGNDVNIRTGLIGTGEVRYVGDLGGGGLEVYVYKDYYTSGTDANPTTVPFMDPRDIVLTGPAVQGARCFGAILDAANGYNPSPIWGKNWVEQDPPVEFIMHQSAPLMVPMQPNATLRARVVA